MAKSGEAQVKLTLIDRITAPLTRIKAMLAGLGKKIGLDRIGTQLSRVGDAFKGLGDGIARSAMRLASVVTVLGAAAAGVVAAAYKIASDTAELGAGLKESSTKLGLGVEPLQEWRYAAKMSAVSSEQLDKAIAKLGVNASSSVRGNKQMAKAFKDLGVKVKDTNGKLKPTETILEDTMTALADMKDPLRRNELAMKLFGKSGVELAKMMADGSKGIKDLREEAHRTGNVLTDETANLGDAFGDNVDKLKEYVQGLKNTLGAALLPVMNEVVQKITAWVDANRALIKQRIEEWAAKFSKVLRDLMNPASDLRKSIDGIAAGFGEFAAKIGAAMDAAKPFVDFVGGPLNASLIAIGAWIMGPTITALAVLTAAFAKLGAVMLATPFGWIVLGAAAAAASVYVLYKKWDEFVAYWGNLWTRIKSAFDKGWLQGIEAVLKEFNPLVHIARGWDAVVEYFTGISLLDEGSRIIGSLADGIKAGIEDLRLDIWEQWIILTNSTSAVFKTLRKLGEDIINALWDGLKSKWDEVTKWLADSIANLVPDWAPEWMKDSLGLSVDGKPGKDGSDAKPDRKQKDDAAFPAKVEKPEKRTGYFDGFMKNLAERAFPTTAKPYEVPEIKTEGVKVDPAKVDVVEPKRKRGDPGRGEQTFGEDIAALGEALKAAFKTVAPTAFDSPGIELPKIEAPQVSSVISLQDAIRAREAGIGGSTTDTLPGKTKDDLGMGSPQSISASSLTVGSVNMPDPIIAHEPQSISAPFSVTLTINANSDPNAIAGAVKSALAAQAAQQAAAVKSSFSD